MADKFLIIPNPTKQEAIDFVPVAAECLVKFGKKVYVPQQYAHLVQCDCILPASDEDMSHVDMAIILGGDGTVLRAVSGIRHYEIPIFGINFGHVGYLTQCEPAEAKECLERVVNGNYEIENRIMIKCYVKRANECLEATGINEVVLHRGAMVRALHIQVYVNDNLIERISADGVLVATPTGSTAYNMSAGGPVVIPTANNVVITPVCAYSMSDCSVVASGDDVVTIRLEPGENHDEGDTACLSVDSIDTFEFSQEDVVTIHKSKYQLKLVKFNNDSFYQTLKHKLRNGKGEYTNIK